jgi:hypothetical protein
MTRLGLALTLIGAALGGACSTAVPSAPDGGSKPAPRIDAAPPDAAQPAADAAPRDAAAAFALPFAVDDQYIPSGYMGDGQTPGAIRDLRTCAPTRPGDARGLCHEFSYTAGTMLWGGVYWQYPEGNWGTAPGLALPAGATEVAFYAWGAQGGELVTFLVGMSDPDGFALELKNVTLTTAPTRYSIDLSATAYGVVVGGFGWVANATTSALTFSIDDIQWR